MDEIASRVRQKGGRAFPVENAEVQFRDALKDLLVMTVSRVAQRAGDFGIYRSGLSRIFEISDKRAFGKETKRTVRAWVRTGGPESPIGPWDIRVYEAWVPESVNGINVVDVYGLVSMGEVVMLRDYLWQLKHLRRPDAVELIAAGEYATVFGPDSEIVKWLQNDSAPPELNQYMKWRHHVHVRTQMFRLTKKDLLTLTEERRIEAFKLAELYYERLQDLRTDDTQWREDGSEKHAWMPLKLLP